MQSNYLERLTTAERKYIAYVVWFKQFDLIDFVMDTKNWLRGIPRPVNDSKVLVFEF